MNKLLLFTLSFLFSATSVFAQLPGTQIWAKSLEPVTDAKEIYPTAPLAVGFDGSVFTTGSFDQTITLGEYSLDNIATSAYLVKRDATGAEQWAVALQGAATITAIDVDKEGNVFVAGAFADKVVVGSTDDKTTTITAKEDGKAKSSAFVAKYDAQGRLAAVRSFYTTPAAMENYFPESGDVYCRLNHVKVSKGKVYLSASFTGNLSLDEVKWEGRFGGIPFVFATDMASAGIFSLNADNLEAAQSVALMQIEEQQAENDSPVEDINFCVDNGVVYAVFVSSGTQVLTTPNHKEKLTFEGKNGQNSHPFVLAVIDDKTRVKVFSVAPHDALYRTDRIKAMTVVGENLYLGGTFYNQLGFAPTLEFAGGASDCFVACLDKSNLSVKWAQNSKYDEGDAKKKREVFTGMLVEKDKVFVTAFDENTANREAEKSLAFEFTAEGTKMVPGDEFVGASAVNGRVYAVSKVKDKMTSTIAYDVTDLVELPSLLPIYRQYADGKLYLELTNPDNIRKNYPKTATVTLTPGSVEGKVNVLLSNYSIGQYTFEDLLLSDLTIAPKTDDSYTLQLDGVRNLEAPIKGKGLVAAIGFSAGNSESVVSATGIVLNLKLHYDDSTYYTLFEQGNPTAVTQVRTNAHRTDAIYDLTGRRVLQPSQGLYIVKGQKVLF